MSMYRHVPVSALPWAQWNLLLEAITASLLLPWIAPALLSPLLWDHVSDSLHRPKSLTRAQGTRGNVYPVGTSKVLILELQDKQLLVESTSVNPPSGKGGSCIPVGTEIRYS